MLATPFLTMKTCMLQRLFGTMLVLALFNLPQLAAATTIAALTLDEIAAAADEIVHGEVISVSAAQEDGRILTRVLIRPDECYVNDGPEPETIDVVVLGGRAENLTTIVHGTESYTVGEEVVVFLSRNPSGTFTSYAMSHSKFSVVEVDGVEEAHRRVDLDALSGSLEGDVTVDVFPLLELDALIRHAVELR